MMHNIAEEIGMEMPDIVLVMMHLNTEDRIKKFIDWAKTKFDGEHLNTDTYEICRAAVRIHKGRTDLP